MSGATLSVIAATVTAAAGGAGGAITWQGATAGGAVNGAASAVVAFPASVAAGEFIGMCGALRANDGGGDAASNYDDPAAAVGFTRVATSISGTGVWGSETGLARAIFDQLRPAAGTESGTADVVWTNSAAASFAGFMFRLSGANAGWQATASASGNQTSAVNAWSVAAGSTIDLQPNDMLIAVTATAQEDGAATDQSLTASGITFSATTQRLNIAASGGFRVCLHVMSATVSSGSGDVAPTANITYAAGPQYGTTLFIRVRNGA